MWLIICLCNFVGYGSFIGKEIGKIIGVGIWIIVCWICDIVVFCWKELKIYDCRVNWGGLLKGME